MRMLPLAVAGVLVVAGVVTAPVVVGSPSTLVVYVAPGGSLHASGLSEWDPVPSLAVAHAIVRNDRVGRDVVVCMAPGTYPTSAVYWDQHTTTADTTIAGECWGGPGETILDGGGAAWVLRVRGTGTGADTRTTISHLTVTGASNGLGLVDGADGVTISHLIFRDLGQAHAPAAPGYFGFQPNGVTGWRVEDSVFERIENTTNPGLIHAIYAANGASDGVVERTRFQDVSGSAIRFRNNSSGNEIRDCLFIDAGTDSPISEWSAAGEAPSVNNTIRHSAHGVGYSGQSQVLFRCVGSTSCPTGRFHRQQSDFSWCATADMRCEWATLVPGEVTP